MYNQNLNVCLTSKILYTMINTWCKFVWFNNNNYKRNKYNNQKYTFFFHKYRLNANVATLHKIDLRLHGSLFSFLDVSVLMQLLNCLKKKMYAFSWRKVTYDYVPKSSLILLQLCLVLRQFLKCRWCNIVHLLTIRRRNGEGRKDRSAWL